MKKAILDTNIWFSATVGGDIALQLPKVLDNPNISILICPELQYEFSDIVNRPKLQQYLKPHRILEIKALMSYFTQNHKILSPILPLSRDPKDDYLLVFSADYKVDYLVTGDKDLLSLQRYQKTEIITFHQFLKELEKL